jgi:hypothetical protein
VEKNRRKGRKSGNWTLQRAVLGRSWLRIVVSKFFRQDSRIKRGKMLSDGCNRTIHTYIYIYYLWVITDNILFFRSVKIGTEKFI